MVVILNSSVKIRSTYVRTRSKLVRFGQSHQKILFTKTHQRTAYSHVV